MRVSIISVRIAEEVVFLRIRSSRVVVGKDQICQLVLSDYILNHSSSTHRFDMRLAVRYGNFSRIEDTVCCKTHENHS